MYCKGNPRGSALALNGPGGGDWGTDLTGGTLGEETPGPTLYLVLEGGRGGKGLGGGQSVCVAVSIWLTVETDCDVELSMPSTEGICVAQGTEAATASTLVDWVDCECGERRDQLCCTGAQSAEREEDA